MNRKLVAESMQLHRGVRVEVRVTASTASNRILGENKGNCRVRIKVYVTAVAEKLKLMLLCLDCCPRNLVDPKEIPDWFEAARVTIS